MTCIIVEDQPPAQRILKRYIEDMDSLHLVGSFFNAFEAMRYLKETDVDLMFLDIHLPKISGLDLLKTLSQPPHVILTTAFPDYALESYELNVVDYLLKPFSFQRFVKAVNKVPSPHSSLTEPEMIPPLARKDLFIKSGFDHVKITIDNIIYIQSDGDYTELFLPEKKHLSPEPLRHWESKLDAQQFVRIHKSYIIQISKIERVSGNRVYLNNNVELPIGRAYKEAFLDRLKE